MDESFEERFKQFLSTARYEVRTNKEKNDYGSITFDFDEIKRWDKDFAQKLLREPDEQFPLMRMEVNHLFNGEVEQQNISVRIINVPLINFRDVASRHLNNMVAMKGIICGISPIRPMVIKATFECNKCGGKTYNPQRELEEFIIYPTKCAAENCKFPSFTFRPELSIFIDSQELYVQERLENLPAGQIPRRMRLVVTKDLIDVVRAGDYVDVCGIVRIRVQSQKATKKTFDMYIDVNSVKVESKEITNIEITPEEEVQIKEVSKDPSVYSKLIDGIVPSIYGNRIIKEAILYFLFGGVRKEFPDITIRGDIHVLLIGDPSTAKSQLLRGTSRIAPRAVFAGGTGSTAAGLTATAIKTVTGYFILEAGSMVLADKGIICIDEMDKMNENDRVAIHEALEQQTVTIAKGGINTVLNARAAALCAANPTYGRYDPMRTMTENLGAFPVTLLSRFDLIFIMRDIPNKEVDEEMASYVLDTRRSTEEKKSKIIPINLLQKYISYARRINPVMTKDAENIIKQFYTSQRMKKDMSSPIAITPRQLESLTRLAEAHARVSLRDKVIADDANAAVKIMEESFENVDVEVRETGRTIKEKDLEKVALDIIQELGREKGITMGKWEKEVQRHFEGGTVPTSDEIQEAIGKVFKNYNRSIMEEGGYGIYKWIHRSLT